MACVVRKVRFFHSIRTKADKSIVSNQCLFLNDFRLMFILGNKRLGKTMHIPVT